MVSVVRLHLINNELEVVSIVISAVSCQYLLNDMSSIPAELKGIDLIILLIHKHLPSSLLLLLLLLLPVYLSCRLSRRLARRYYRPLIAIYDND